MLTVDRSNLDVALIITLDEGCIDEPMLFRDPQLAEKHYEEIVKQKGFISRFESQSFDDYKESFMEWEDTQECPYDKMDFEIHIWL